MRTMLAGIVALAAVILCLDAGRPAVAGDQFSLPDRRSNFVYRPWGTRYTYRATWWDWHRTWSLGPRNHFRLRRDGIDLQLRDRWQAHVDKEPVGDGRWVARRPRPGRQLSAVPPQRSSTPVK